MLTPSSRKPSRNFGPIVPEALPEAASKHATAELSRLSTAANDLTIGGRAVLARFPPRQHLGSVARPDALSHRAARGRSAHRTAGAGRTRASPIRASI